MMKKPWFVDRCSWLVLLLACTLAAPALSAPRAESAEECYFFSDVAIVAKALYVEQIPDATADKALVQIYRRAINNGGERFGQTFVAVVNAARKRDGYSALDFAQRLYETCVSRGGDMSSIFGADT